MVKNFDGHVRFSEAEKDLMVKAGLGVSRVWRVGLDTIRLWIQPNNVHPCVYLYNTGKNPAPPAAAPMQSPAPIAQGCPCQACPIRAAFGHVPHERCGQKENERSGPAAAADQIT